MVDPGSATDVEEVFVNSVGVEFLSQHAPFVFDAVLRVFFLRVLQQMLEEFEFAEVLCSEGGVRCADISTKVDVSVLPSQSKM